MARNKPEVATAKCSCCGKIKRMWIPENPGFRTTYCIRCQKSVKWEMIDDSNN